VSLTLKMVKKVKLSNFQLPLRPFLIRGKMVDGGKPHVVKKNAHWGFG
jgi:hypothetical protein